MSETAGAVLRRWRGPVSADAVDSALGLNRRCRGAAALEAGSRMGLGSDLGLIARAYCAALGCPERTGELLCELTAALDNRPWYRVEEVPPPEGRMVEVTRIGEPLYDRDMLLPARSDIAWTHWRPLGRGPEGE